ncbi:MAG TPA: hypothetical protein VG675_22985 [Bryobacteraceae bacterium]|nr:hypothetical protein [Bryobacteraceae bacterium]
MAKARDYQIGKSVITPDRYSPVVDSLGHAAIKYGGVSSGDPNILVTFNNVIKQAWANNQANLVDLHYSLSWMLGVMDTDPNSSMYRYAPVENFVAPFEVQPTIILTDLPNLHVSKRNGEVRAVFQGVPQPVN